MSNELNLKYKWGQVVKYGSEGSKCVVVEVDTDEHTGLPYLVKHEYGGEEWCSEDELSPWEPEQVEAQPIAQDSGWIECNGGEQPVADDVEVEVVFEDDSGSVMKARMVWWPDPALKRYRVVNRKQEVVDPLVIETQKEKPQMKRKQDVAVGDRVVYTDNDYDGKYRGKEGVVIKISQDYNVDTGPNWIDILVEGIGKPCALPAQWEYVEHQQPVQSEPLSMIVSPKHYVLFPEQGIEVRHVNKAWMDKIANEGEYVSHHEAAWLVQATQYIFRSPFKGSTIEDLNKAIRSLQYVVESMNARKASK